MTKVSVWVFMFIGVAYFSMSNYFNVQKILRA